MRFTLKAGKLTMGDKVYKPGDVVESNSPLDTIFVNKFEKVLFEHPAPVAAAPVELSPVLTEEVIPPTPVQVAEEGILGTDVTSEFPDAEKAELSVFKKGDLFFITEKDKPSVPLNNAGVTKKQADKMIKGLI